MMDELYKVLMVFITLVIMLVPLALSHAWSSQKPTVIRVALPRLLGYILLVILVLVPQRYYAIQEGITMRANEIILGACRVGQGFFLGNDYRGVLLDKNECEARVKIQSTTTHEVRETNWSLGTVVIPTTERLDFAKPATSLVCSKCGKVCSSLSGLTLHSKGCAKISK